MKSPVRVTITGAAGNIGYALAFRIAAGNMLGPDQPVILQLLEIPPALPALKGVVMELNDCAFPLLDGIVATDDLDTALQNALRDLDGFYTFAVGSKDGFAVVIDPIGCKPAVMAETEDWAAMSSEFRAIATLPGVDNARIWEPVPTRIYSWQREVAA